MPVPGRRIETVMRPASTSAPQAPRMPSLHPLTQDSFVLALGAGAASRLSLRRGLLEMLLDPPEGVKPKGVPLMLGRDHEAGEARLSRTGRTLELRVHDPPRLFLAKADDARRLLRGELEALALTEATDSATGPPGAPGGTEEEAARAAADRQRAHAERLRALVEKRLGPKKEGPSG